MSEEKTENNPLSVSSALSLAKNALEAATITLVGEVSELSNKAGYKAVYFTVKDEKSSLPAFMWMNRFKAAEIDLKVGMLVKLTGRFTVYEAKGRMNFDVFSLSLFGEGDLRQKVANLAKKLQAEGLMDASHKRAIPQFPHTVGLVTSPRGAAVHDVLRTLRRRWPLARIVLAGVPVEGAGAAANLIEGLTCVENSGAEVILLVRGGGSFEDLMPFNDERLARKIASCKIPVITGIGHEPDNSIADMVSDFRASTPTAAAESVAPDISDLHNLLDNQKKSLHNILNSRLSRTEEVLNNYASRPALADASMLFANDALTIDYLSERLKHCLPSLFERNTMVLSNCKTALIRAGHTLLAGSSNTTHDAYQRFKMLSGNILVPFNSLLATNASRLNDLSPLAVLGRGYSITQTTKNELVASLDQVSANDEVYITVSDGKISCKVEDKQYSDTELIAWKE